jgi:hypothetical protein
MADASRRGVFENTELGERGFSRDLRVANPRRAGAGDGDAASTATQDSRVPLTGADGRRQGSTEEEETGSNRSPGRWRRKP